MTTVDWSCWTVVLLKPDCVRRGLVQPVLDLVGAAVTVVHHRITVATESQILTHYDDLLTTRRPYFACVDVESDLRRTYVGQPVGVALGFAPEAASRLRDRLGHYDPSRADSDTIRGRYGVDSLHSAQADHRLIANLIHSSDDSAGAEREFGIWYGDRFRHLIEAPKAQQARHTS